MLVVYFFLGGTYAIIILIFIVTVVYALIKKKLYANKEEERERRRTHHYYSRANAKSRDPRMIPARLHAIEYQWERYRKQRYDDDRRSAFRDYITIIVVGLTAIFALASDVIFKLQLDAMRKDSRAWVGPVSGGLQSDSIAVNSEAKFVVTYHNTGKEPATDVFIDMQPYIITIAEDEAGVTKSHINEYVGKCARTATADNSEVVFPTTGFSSYTLTDTITKDLIDWGIIYGTKVIVMTGCYVYRTQEEVHRTTFCFYFQNGRTTPRSWAFCTAGNYAN